MCRACRDRHQDRSATDRRIWRPGNAAVARRRDQAAETARSADRERREGADIAATGAARRQGQTRRAARRTRGARARRAQADRVPEGDGILDADPPRRRVFADRSGRCGGGQQQGERDERASAAPASARLRRAAGGDLFAIKRPHPALPRKRERERTREAGRAQDRRQASRAPRFRSPPRAPKPRGKPRSIATSTRPSAASIAQRLDRAGA